MQSFKCVVSTIDGKAGATTDVGSGVAKAWTRWIYLTGFIYETQVPTKTKSLIYKTNVCVMLLQHRIEGDITGSKGDIIAIDMNRRSLGRFGRVKKKS